MQQNAELNNIVPTNLTLCVVTYEKDFDLLERLIRSVYLFWDTQHIKFLIILNDDRETEEELINITKKYSILGIKIEVIWAGNIIKIEQYNWHTQQLMKILIAKYVKTSWFMLLDSKNYFEPNNKKHKISDFFSPTGKAYGTWGTNPDFFFFKNQYEIAYKLWNLELSENERVLNEFTPLFLYTKIMAELVIELEQRFQSFLPYFFKVTEYSSSFVTEFSIMSAFIKHKKMEEELYEHLTHYDDVMIKLGKTLGSNKDLRRS